MGRVLVEISSPYSKSDDLKVEVGSQGGSEDQRMDFPTFYSRWMATLTFYDHLFSLNCMIFVSLNVSTQTLYIKLRVANPVSRVTPPNIFL